MPRTKTTRRRTNVTAAQAVADQVRTLRVRSGSGSQQDLADRLGWNQSTVARVESGKRAITVDELFALAVALDVAPVELLSASFDPTNVPVAGTGLTPAEAREWVKGERPLPGGDEGRYWTNVPADELTVRMRLPGLYLLRFQLNDLTRAMLADNLIEADAALDTIDHVSAATRRELEQINGGKPAFYKARQERGN